MPEVYKIEEELLSCNANNSRAFELSTIEKHYLKEVTSMTKGIRQN